MYSVGNYNIYVSVFIGEFISNWTEGTFFTWKLWKRKKTSSSTTDWSL